jgi:hypothetical protein
LSVIIEISIKENKCDFIVWKVDSDKKNAGIDFPAFLKQGFT